MLKPYLDTLQAHNTRIIAAGGGGASGWSLTGNSSAVTDFLGTTNDRTMRFRTNNVERMVIDSVGNVRIGSLSSVSTATPKYLSIGGEFGSNTPGSVNNLKMRLYDLGGSNAFGIGVSAAQMEFQQTTNNDFVFYVNGVEGSRISSNKFSINKATKQAEINVGKNTGTFSNPSIDFFGTLSSGTEVYNAGRIYGQFSGNSNADARLTMAYPTDANVFVDLLTVKNGSVGIGTITPSTKAILDITSTTKGILIPRMTTAQRDAISSPATALQVFSTTDSTNYIYRGTTSGWQATITGIKGSGTLDFGSIAHHDEEVLTFTVTGAAEGDVVSLGVPNASNLTNVIFNAWVSAANTISVKCSNLDQSAAKDPASGTFKVTVFK